MTCPDALPHLAWGSHRSDEGEVCAMEAAAWLAGEKWSDDPRSVHRAIRWVARTVNDEVSEDLRQTLWPLIMASLDTARPGHPWLNWRLGRFGRKTMAEATHGGDLVGAWQEVLEEHARLYGEHCRPSIMTARLQSLLAHVERR